MSNNVDTEHKHMYSLYIGSLCKKSLHYMFITLYLHRNSTGICENLKTVKQSIKLCLVLREAKNIYE